MVGRLLAARSRARFEPPDQRHWIPLPVAACADAALREREAREALYARWDREVRHVAPESTPAFRA